MARRRPSAAGFGSYKDPIDRPTGSISASLLKQYSACVLLSIRTCQLRRRVASKRSPRRDVERQRTRANQREQRNDRNGHLNLKWASKIFRLTDKLPPLRDYSVILTTSSAAQTGGCCLLWVYMEVSMWYSNRSPIVTSGAKGKRSSAATQRRTDEKRAFKKL